jgi:hypothetical protein
MKEHIQKTCGTQRGTQDYNWRDIAVFTVFIIGEF